jgi:hypothetical protein
VVSLTGYVILTIFSSFGSPTILFLRLRKHKNARMARAKRAKVPITTPTMAPILVLLSVRMAVFVGDASAANPRLVGL